MSILKLFKFNALQVIPVEVGCVCRYGADSADELPAYRERGNLLCPSPLPRLVYNEEVGL